MKRNFKFLFCLLLFCFFVGVNSVSAEKFNFAFSSNASEVSGNIKNISNALKTGTPIQCLIGIYGEEASGFTCKYLPEISYDKATTFSFVPPKDKNNKVKKYMYFSNSRGSYNTLRITGFKSTCKNDKNHVTCTLDKVTFKWENNDKCNTPSRTGGPKGVSGIAACAGGISIFCDKYKNMTDAQARDHCSGAYKSDSSLTAVDVMKKCDTLDVAAFEKWCKYGSGLGGSDDENKEEKKASIEEIMEWAETVENTDPNSNLETTTCSALLSTDDEELVGFIKTVVYGIAIVGIVILILSTAGDFLKAITSGEADKMSDTFKRFKNRIIAVIILLLLPLLVNWIITFLNNYVIQDEDGTVRIGDVSECQIID